eukprot:TRINITY_DN15134_c0_g1_i1.p2 TRINITY_DN15134_c0_g1~~TRINITY_DN15134_c0_g1_i1.p2  ORF type:complete len:129 (+),score=5.10 TRINITY_DN15134_c0_g1_i1:18-404(+)
MPHTSRNSDDETINLGGFDVGISLQEREEIATFYIFSHDAQRMTGFHRNSLKLKKICMRSQFAQKSGFSNKIVILLFSDLLCGKKLFDRHSTGSPASEKNNSVASPSKFFRYLQFSKRDHPACRRLVR